MSYEVRFTKEAVQDIKKLPPRLKEKLRSIILNTIVKNPYSGKKLVGDLTGFYSLRLTYKDRIVYTVNQKRKIVFIHRTRTHYEE